MINALSPVMVTRLEKLAMDSGFDKQLPRQGQWLAFASTQAPLRIWLSTIADKMFLAALSQGHVADALADHGIAMTSPLPEGAVAGRTADDMDTLYRMMRRAFQLSRSLPNQLLHDFQTKTAHLPRTTEVERMVVQRIGQDQFRTGLLEYWEGRCAITGLGIASLLRASHIKPWSKCATDAERLDVYNGLLLAPT